MSSTGCRLHLYNWKPGETAEETPRLAINWVSFNVCGVRHPLPWDPQLRHGEKLHKINLNLWFSNRYELMVKQNIWHSWTSVANGRFLMFNVFKVCPVIWQISKLRRRLRLYKANCRCAALTCFHICTLSPGVKNILPITTAKVPIVKFYHVRTGLEGDISLYNTLVGLFLLLFFPRFAIK